MLVTRKTKITICILTILPFIAFSVTGIMYLCNFEKCSDVQITTCTVISAKDNPYITGNISGSILYVQGSASEESVYKYYYKTENGDVEPGTIPTHSTEICPIKSGEEPYLEKTVTIEYICNNNKTPATRYKEKSEETYKLYVPKGFISKANAE